MKSKIVLIAMGLSLAECQSVLKTEPPRGSLAAGEKVLVDNGACPGGQVQQVTGATQGVARKKECVPAPK